jgi:hypothetical protein
MICRAIRRGTFTDNAARSAKNAKHWTKFLQHAYSFFHFQQTEGAKIIVMTWVNDKMVTALIAQTVRLVRPNIQAYDAREVDPYQRVLARYLVGVKV